jgi:hypothetical protein
MSYFTVTPVNVTPVTTGSWQAVDLDSFFVTSLAGSISGVKLIVKNTSTATSYAVGLRKNGSADNRITNIGTHYQGMGAVGVDASNIFEAYVGNASVQIWLVGYHTDDAVFFTTGVSKTLSGGGMGDAWRGVDISADTGADTAIGAIFERVSAANVGLRKNGSTDNRTQACDAHIWGECGVDGTENCDAYGSNGDVYFLIGYVKSSAVYATNATNISLSTSGSWIDYAAASASVAQLIETISSATTYTYGVRDKDDSATSLLDYPGGASHAFDTVGVDASYVSQGNISNTGVDSYRLGYFTNPAVVKTYTGVGGASTSGVATTQMFASKGLYTGVGGAASGGVSAVLKVKATLASGGAATVGAASVAKGKDFPVSGGIAASGVAQTLFGHSYIASGGAQTAGTATLAKTKAPTGSGGAQTGGVAEVSKDKLTSVSGGVTTGGAATTEWYATLSVSTLPMFTEGEICASPIADETTLARSPRVANEELYDFEIVFSCSVAAAIYCEVHDINDATVPGTEVIIRVPANSTISWAPHEPWLLEVGSYFHIHAHGAISGCAFAAILVKRLTD